MEEKETLEKHLLKLYLQHINANLKDGRSELREKKELVTQLF